MPKRCSKDFSITIDPAVCGNVSNLRCTGFSVDPTATLVIHFDYVGPVFPLPTITWQKSTDGVTWTTVGTNVASVGDNARTYTALSQNTLYYVRVLLTNCVAASNVITQITWPDVITTDLGDCPLACGGEVPGNLNQVGNTTAYSFDNPLYGALGLVTAAGQFELNTCQGIFTKVRSAYPSADALPLGIYANTTPEPDACVMSCTLTAV